MFKKVHHIAFAVYDLKKNIHLLKTMYGLTVDREIVIADRKMKAVLFKIGGIWLECLAPGGIWLECLAPISDDSPLNVFLKDKGEGFHHIAYQVDSIQEASTQLPKDALFPVRKSNVGEWVIADIDPKYGLGMNAQLIEE